MSTSEEFQVKHSDRKRKREAVEAENSTMDTEQTPTTQFPQINPSELQVSLRTNSCLRRNKTISIDSFRSKRIAFAR